MRQRSVGIASELECAQDGQVMVARGPDMRPSLPDVESEDPLHRDRDSFRLSHLSASRTARGGSRVYKGSSRGGQNGNSRRRL